MRLSVSTQPFLPFGAEEKEPPSASRDVSRLVGALAKVCRELPLEEKILVSPSFFTGHQIVESLARSGVPWVHLRVESVRSLAHGVVGASLADEGLTLLSRAQALAFVEQACAEALGQTSYFGELALRPGLHRAIQSAFDELRSAGISPSDLPGSAFDDPKKIADLRAVLNRYEAALAREGFVDRADVLRRAVEVLRAKPPTAGALYLLALGSELSAIERELIERISAGRLRMLETDDPDDWTTNARRARLFRALGEENEVREVFRRIFVESIPLDDVEILTTDPATYGSLVWELSQEHAIPCTFEGGVAATFTRPAQAVLGYLRWLGRNYEAEELREILAAGLLDLTTVSGRAEPPGSRPAARELREARIGWGRERSLTCLEAHVRRRAAEVESARRRAGDSEEDATARVEWQERRLATARVAQQLVVRLLSLSSTPLEGEVELKDVARASSAFVREFARVSGDLDAMAASALQGLFGELETLPVTKLQLADAVGRLADAVRALHVGADRPRPAHLHFADYRSGGFSGRTHTFLVGLDSRRHPGSGLQDPVLLDEERRGINAAVRPLELAMRGTRPAENTLALKACLSRVRGEVTASYAAWNLLEGRDQFPAAVFLETYRWSSGASNADYSDLAKGLAEAAGFLTEADRTLDDTEWWLAKVQGSLLPAGKEAGSVRSAYPWLDDGFIAENARDSPEFTRWDGLIGDPSGLDPRTSGKPTSCSRIEDLARCPYSYFLKRVLRIRPSEEARSDPTVWLEAMEAGLLIHDVFRRFYMEAVDGLGKPAFDRDWSRLEKLAHEEIARWKELIPPRSTAAFESLCDDIFAACRIFLRDEERHCRNVTPRWFEVAFGPWHEDVRAPGRSEAVRIPLGGGQSFLLSGRIDRVDEEDGAPAPRYQVWDYKTGSSWNTAEPDRGRGGRRIQDALYAQALEALIEGSGEHGRVVSSGYFYPGRRGEGERYTGNLDAAETRETLNALFDLLASGAFPHSPTKEDCSLCDFQKICGGVERAADRAKVKIENAAANPILDPYRKLNPA
jgi:ATP-dependent helicase/nuclease subunit B